MRVAFCPPSSEALRPNLHVTQRRREIGGVVGDRQVAQFARIKAIPLNAWDVAIIGAPLESASTALMDNPWPSIVGSKTHAAFA